MFDAVSGCIEGGRVADGERAVVSSCCWLSGRSFDSVGSEEDDHATRM